MTDQPTPTASDLANAAMRQAVEFNHCKILALRKLGPGWKPWMKLSLYHTEDCGRKGKDDPAPTPVAVAYKVFRGKGETKRVRYLCELPMGEILASERYEDVFGSLLEENHPTKTIQVRGLDVPVKRYQLYWSAVELYSPKDAEEMATLRVSREAGNKRREDARFAAENPLLFQAGIKRQDLEPEERGR